MIWSILCVFETTSGLGHMRRLACIANYLVEKGARVRVASGTFIDKENFFHPEIDFIELPAHRIWNSKDGKWFHYGANGRKIEDTNFDENKWKKKREKIFRRALKQEPIHAMVVEFWPFSRRREFTSAVNIVLSQKSLPYKPLIFSSARDILDTSNSMKKTANQVAKDQRKSVKMIRDSVDKVLVHADPALVSFAEGFAYWRKIEKKTIYTGYVVTDNAREKMGDERNTKMVVVSTGSGSTGLDLIKAAAKARRFSTLRDHNWTYILGPRMEKSHKIQALREIARFGNGSQVGSTAVYNHRADLPQILRRASLSISLAGYNTTLEVLASGVPAILVPKFKVRTVGKPWADAEQKGRLHKINAKHLATFVYPSTAIKPRSFAAKIDRAHRESVNRATLNFQGARNSAEIVLGQVKERFGDQHIHDFATVEELKYLYS